MAIKNLDLRVGGTLSSTGGTLTSVQSKGTTLNTTRVIVDDGDSLADQSEIRFSVKEPRADESAPNGYTQARCNFTLYRPVTPTDGQRTLNSVSVSLSYDPHSTDAQVQELLNMAAETMVDTETQNFFTDQSVE